MKNKIQLIDVSMLSSYMGKALTGIVTLFVIGIAVSALIDGSGIERNVIRMSVPRGHLQGEALDRWEPFRALLARETRRPVVVTEADGEWPAGFDLYVLPADVFFENESRLAVTALFDVRSDADGRDKALVIANALAGPVDISSVRPDEIVFADPRSVNGFWVQADALAGKGVAIPADAKLRFDGTMRDATRVVFDVVFGRCTLGACRSDELSALTARGIIRPREVLAVLASDELPETIIAADRREARYFEKRISSLARLLDEPGSVSGQGDTVRLLKARGVERIEPLSAPRIERTRALYERFGKPASSNAAVSP
jgi:hypothetical protein